VSRRRTGPMLVLALLALLPGRRMVAQAEGALGGVVRDAATRSPVPDVLVTVEEGRRGAVTDSAGSYRIRQLRAGTYTVTLRRIGYRPRALTGVVVRAGATTPLDVTLDPSPLQLEELAVEAVSDPLLDPLRTQSEQRITAQDLRQLPVASLADAVALTAGTVGESFRGGRPGQQSFILDGLGVKNQLDASTSGGVLRIPPDILTEASVITNGFSARYGQALSGLINVVTRDGGERWSGRAAYETDRPLSGSADRGLDRMVFSADGPVVGGVRALVGVDLNARQDFDPVNAPAPIPADDPRSSTPYPLPHNSGEQYTGTAKLTIPIGQRQTVRLFGLMSSEQRLLYDQSYKYDTDFAPGLRVAGTLVTGQWQYASAPTAKRPFVLDVRAGWFDREFMRGELAQPLEQQFGAFTFDRMHFVGEEIAVAQDTAAARAPVPGFTPPGYSSNTPWGVPAFFLGGGSRGEIAWNRYQELRTQVDGTFGLGRGDLFFGGEYLSQDVKTFQRALAALPVGSGDSVPAAAASAFQPQAFAIYTELNQRLDDLGIVLGLRYDQFDSRQDLPGEEGGPKQQLNPRIAVSTVLKGATVVASIGSFSQPPDYQYLVDAAFDDTTRTGRFRQGNPNLGFEQAWQFEFSVRGRPSRDLELRTGVYFKRLDGLVASVPLGFDPDSSIFGNADYGTVRGLELIAERPLRNGWGTRLLYTLQYATASSSSAFLLRRSYTIDPGTGDTIIPARVEFPLDYDRRHNLTAIVQGMAPGRFGPRVLGMRPFAAWEASLVLRFLSGLPYTPLSPPPDTLLGAPNDARLPWTSTVDMLIRRPIVLGRVRTGLYLDVRNLFNRENIVAVRRDTGSPFATNEIIETMAEEAYAANPYAIPFESPRYRPAADLDGNGRIEGRGELFPLYVSAARDVSQPVFFYGPPRLVRLGVEVIF
jgi:outer membrane receptor protein involved in Fe transport